VRLVIPDVKLPSGIRGLLPLIAYQWSAIAQDPKGLTCSPDRKAHLNPGQMLEVESANERTESRNSVGRVNASRIAHSHSISIRFAYDVFNHSAFELPTRLPGMGQCRRDTHIPRSSLYGASHGNELLAWRFAMKEALLKGNSEVNYASQHPPIP